MRVVSFSPQGDDDDTAFTALVDCDSDSRAAASCACTSRNEMVRLGGVTLSGVRLRSGGSGGTDCDVMGDIGPHLGDRTGSSAGDTGADCLTLFFFDSDDSASSLESMDRSEGPLLLLVGVLHLGGRIFLAGGVFISSSLDMIAFRLGAGLPEGMGDGVGDAISAGSSGGDGGASVGMMTGVDGIECKSMGTATLSLPTT